MTTESGIECDDYLQQLSRGGLATSSISFRDFIFQNFGVIDFISLTIKKITKNEFVRSVLERVSLNLGYNTNFTCDLHKLWGEKIASRTVVNIFFNNEQKHANDLVVKEQIVEFKKGQKEGAIIAVLNFSFPCIFMV